MNLIKKYVFLGDTDSINIELISKSHFKLKNKVKYILLGNIKDLSNYLKKISSKLIINEIFDPLNFESLDKNALNIFNIENISRDKGENILNQIRISNYLSNKSKLDLVTMPINKSLLKKNINFIGMTEYLSELNNKKTVMLMHGEKFSVIPLTTHINLNDVKKFLKKNKIKKTLQLILSQIKRNIYLLNFEKIKFLCFNPHCSENNTIGLEDKIISDSISNFKEISGPFSSDSSFDKLDYKTLFISMYHDQVLIPFKILNSRSVNLTLGLNYKRLSPAHGTAKDIKYKNKGKISSYLACMEF